MKLSGKIFLGFSIVLIMLVISFFYGFKGLTRTEKRFTRYNKLEQSSSSLVSMEENILSGMADIKKYFHSLNTEGFSNSGYKWLNLFKNIEKNYKKDIDPLFSDQYEYIMNEFIEYNADFEKTIDYTKKRNQIIRTDLEHESSIILKTLSKIMKTGNENKNILAVYLSGVIQNHCMQILANLNKYLESGSNKYLKNGSAEINRFKNKISIFKTEVKDNIYKSNVEKISKSSAEFIKAYNQLVAINTERARLVLSLDKKGGNICKNIKEIRESIIYEQTKLKNRLAKEHKMSVVVMMFITVVAIIIGIISSIFIIRTVTIPIGKVVSQTREVAKGNLSEEITDIKSNDEIGDLVKSTNDVVNSFQNVARVCEAAAIGDFTKTIHIRGRKDVMGRAIKQMIDNFKKVVAQAKKIAKGDYSSHIKPLSEKDELSMALKKMTESLRKFQTENNNQVWLKSGIAELNETMHEDLPINALAQKIISFIGRYLDIRLGALYIKTAYNIYRLSGSYKNNAQEKFLREFKPDNELPGKAVLEKKIIIFENDSGEYIKNTSSSENDYPINFMIIPLIFEHDVHGLLEIRTNNSFSILHKNFIHRVSESIAVVINSAKYRQRLKELLKKTRQQAEHLEQHKDQLKKTNKELEDKTKLLEFERKKVEKQNVFLQKAREELAEHADAMTIASQYKSEFLANMSHELRSPLNSMLILSKLLTENREGNLNEKQVEDIKTIYNSGQNLLTLINDILDLSKIEAGKIDLYIEKISISEIVNYVRQNFNPVSEEKGIYFEVTVDEDIPANIYSDRKCINQILTNLLSNAFKFTFEGYVKLNISRPESDIKFVLNKEMTSSNSIAFLVTDTGMGISKDKQHLIFEAFQQEDGSITRNFGGTGLGLSICRELSEKLGGEIHVRSEQGKGSIFALYLPEKMSDDLKVRIEKKDIDRKQQVEKAKGKSKKVKFHRKTKEILQEEVLPVKSNIKKKKILVIDDDMRTVFSLMRLLEDRGMAIVVAENGKEGIEKLKENADTALIVMDIVMPVMDGFEAIKKIREIEQFKKIPIVVVTARAEKKEESINAGVSDFLVKPLDTEKFLSLLNARL